MNVHICQRPLEVQLRYPMSARVARARVARARVRVAGRTVKMAREPATRQ